jgi:hypothetical protein
VIECRLLAPFGAHSFSTTLIFSERNTFSTSRTSNRTTPRQARSNRAGAIATKFEQESSVSISESPEQTANDTSEV